MSKKYNKSRLKLSDEILKEVFRMLKVAPRSGAKKDIPEGSRYIQISDTFANEFIKKIENHFSS